MLRIDQSCSINANVLGAARQKRSLSYVCLSKPTPSQPRRIPSPADTDVAGWGVFNASSADGSGKPRNCQLTIYNIYGLHGLMDDVRRATMEIFSSFQQYDDLLTIHAISTNLPYDAGMENLLSGALRRVIASSI